ncbi:tRNA lysidine(34) synthetase [Occultella kanbiaonis]|uniref:tRNA lysidine(34) synthetase n=1 Tax=Occultella kanbiaonis TaxID=2675754 RepID=UPI001B354F63|nr:tRNA lysidine(34) synthetase [Occultella kanbiaonis]
MPRLDPAVAAVRAAVRTFLQDRLGDGTLAPGGLVLVACSGGADSLALAAATAFVAPRLGVRAGAVSVDHGLQDGSRAVSERAVAVCAGLGLVPAEVVGPDGAGTAGGDGPGRPGVGSSEDGAVRPGSAAVGGGARGAAGEGPDGAAVAGATRGAAGEGPEGAARALRYDLLGAAAARHGAAGVLLGHTRADQAETVLLGLARGSGTRALAGMAPIRGTFWRPLLGVGREQTRRACDELGLAAWEDPTNAADGPLRTAAGAALPRAAVRERVLPELARALGPGVEVALARTADLARDDADLLDELARQLLERARRTATDTATGGPADARTDGPADARTDGPTRNATGMATGPSTGADPVEDSAAVDPAATAVVLDVSVLVDAHPALRRRALRLAAVEAGADGGALARVHVQGLDALLTDWHGQGPIHLPGPTEAVRRYGRLFLRAPEASARAAAPDDPHGPTAPHRHSDNRES